MKKRFVFLLIISIIAFLISLFLFTPIYEMLKTIDILADFMLKLDTLLFSDGKFYESIFGGIVLFFSFIFLLFALSFVFIKKVDDSTMPPISVEQKIIAIDYNKNDSAPSMVVVHENIIDDGGNK